MKKITQEEIKNILVKHKIWLEDRDNKEAEQADLRESDLRESDLRGADLQGADLRGADLQGAYLQGAYLQGADLRGADLRESDLRGADLQGADLQGAYLRGADYGAIQCPEEGDFVAFKQCKDGKIVKLLIPADAKRSSATSRKCRASKAVVLEITDIKGEVKYDEARSKYDNGFIYKKGETIEIKDFDEDRWNECSTGIHFFITRQEAVDY